MCQAVGERRGIASSGSASIKQQLEHCKVRSEVTAVGISLEISCLDSVGVVGTPGCLLKEA